MAVIGDVMNVAKPIIGKREVYGVARKAEVE
jgi:hypothetical protein